MLEKSIYLLLTRSETSISKLIHFATSDTYTHVMISFDGDFSNWYSFSRKYRHFPLPAGLKKEALHWMFTAPCALFRLPVTQEIWESAKGIVEAMFTAEEKYRYNVVGLPLCWAGIEYSRENHYFCSEFVGTVLVKSGAASLPKPPSLMRPSDYEKLKQTERLFTGNITDLLWKRGMAYGLFAENFT